MTFPYEPFDLSGVRTYPLASRASKARAADFARPYTPGAGLAGWIDRLPTSPPSSAPSAPRVRGETASSGASVPT